MRIAILGTGYVGLVTGCGLAKLGHHVTCLDLDPSKIEDLNRGVAPFFEPDIQSLMGETIATNNLRFSDKLAENLREKDLIIIAVGTPSMPDGDANLSYIFAASDMILQHADPDTLVVTKSTVPVGTNRQIAAKFNSHAPKKMLRVASSPEFLREGSAFADFFKPDRIVIGVDDSKSEKQLKTLFAAIDDPKNPLNFIIGNWESAELIKYAANSFLATKVAFINELADISEGVGADIDVVAAGMGSDPRIGAAFLKSGPGYGGSCFPKDMLALVATAQRVGLPAQIAQSTIAANEGRMRSWARRISSLLGQPLKGLNIAQLGLSFKANTDDVRASPAISLARSLMAQSVNLSAYDPQASVNGLRALPELQIADNAIQCAKDADALVVATEWPEFSDIDMKKLRKTMRGDWIFDLRGVFDPLAVTAAGLIHYRVGHAIAYPSKISLE